ncbi:unnamed protein product [Victoria cruziana]
MDSSRRVGDGHLHRLQTLPFPSSPWNFRSERKEPCEQYLLPVDSSVFLLVSSSLKESRGHSQRPPPPPLRASVAFPADSQAKLPTRINLVSWFGAIRLLYRRLPPSLFSFYGGRSAW